MRKIKIDFKDKKKYSSLTVKKVPWWYEGIGLMFSRKRSAEAMLFSFRKPKRMAIFSLFIPFDFLAVWLDEKNEIIEKRVVSPGEFNVLPSRKFVKLIEIPINGKYDEVLELLGSPTRIRKV
ncbi:MAG: DUF192 domain-containing protein [Nanoarchaeota archaeon]|nr:DUF192 domain-containing protein [Nanoarchaeota archaeon]